MSKKAYPAAKVKLGKTYLHRTFAGVEVQSRIVEITNKENGIFMGVLTDMKYVDNLRDASVSYPKNVVLSECIGVVYAFQIIREIRGPRKQKNDKQVRNRRRIVRKSKA